MNRIRLSFFILILTSGCGKGAAPSNPHEPAPGLTGLPIEFTAKQRSTMIVPGSGGSVRLTLDDITRGQVMVSLAKVDGSTLLSPVSVRSGGLAVFVIDSASYTLTLTEMSNSLIGEDFAQFVISKGVSKHFTEEKKIEQLIATIGELNEAVFIRNGAEYSSEDAAQHLRMKWEAGSGSIQSASQFIGEIATRSSETGEPYRIRLPNGSEVQTGEFLRERLLEFEHDQ